MRISVMYGVTQCKMWDYTFLRVKEADLPLAYRLNGSNLPDNGLSPDQRPTTAMADKRPPCDLDPGRPVTELG